MEEADDLPQASRRQSDPGEKRSHAVEFYADLFIAE